MSKTKEENVTPRLQWLDGKATRRSTRRKIGGSISVSSRRGVKDTSILSSADEPNRNAQRPCSFLKTSLDKTNGNWIDANVHLFEKGWMMEETNMQQNPNDSNEEGHDAKPSWTSEPCQRHQS
eukprot:GHVT01050222.1.p2 GENE.GHVT01050222.1~~GHVT01050222.1.p2  ORF type:complete len:123 (+),score=9.29 GHVT01050222.1:225-593(+)